MLDKRIMFVFVFFLLIQSSVVHGTELYVNTINYAPGVEITRLDNQLFDKATLLLVFEPQYFYYSNGQFYLKNLANPGLDMKLIDNTDRDKSYPEFYYDSILGYYYNFDGSQYGIVPNDPSLNPDGKSFSMFAIYYLVPFKGSGNNAIIDKGYYSHTTPHYQYHLGVTGSQYGTVHPSFGVDYSLSNTLTRVYIAKKEGVQDYHWYALAGVLDCEKMEERLIVYDITTGHLIEKRTPISSCNNVDYGSDLYIMRFKNVNAKTPGGLKTIIIFKDRTLNKNDVLSLVYYFKFRDKSIDAPESGTIIIDKDSFDDWVDPQNKMSIDGEGNLAFIGAYSGDNRIIDLSFSLPTLEKL